MKKENNKRPTVTAHVLVKNEENYVWYAINSVLPFVDKMIIFDTGSTDKTVEIIKEIVKKDTDEKIVFEEKGEVDKQRHTNLRNEMISRTKTDWFMILDGDEVWPDEQIRFLLRNDIQAAEKINRNCIMVSYHLSALDLYHYTESGHFGTKWGLHGHLTYRCFKRVGGIKWIGNYGSDTLYYNNLIEVIEQDNLFYSTTYFWHLSKLNRSSKSNLRVGWKKKSKINSLPIIVQKKLYKHINPSNLPKIFNEKN